MKITNKLFTGLIILVLLLLPFQAVQAKGLADGPIFGSSYTLKSGETLSQDLVVIGGSISIEKNATVTGAVVLIGGSLTLDGEVTKDVVVLGGAVRLGPNTHVHGNLVTYGGPVNRDAASRVDGDVVNNLSSPSSPMAPAPITPAAQPVTNVFSPLLNAIGIFGQSVMLALLAMLIAMFLPVHLRRVADSASSQPFVAIGVGLLTTILYIVAIVALILFSLFIITLILTIPLAIIISVMLSAASVLGWLALGLEVGVRASTMFKSEWPLPLAAGVGVFVLNLVAQGIGFIPCVGWLFSSVLSLVGLGAVMMTRFGTRAPSFAPAVLEPVAAPLPTE